MTDGKKRLKSENRLWQGGPQVSVLGLGTAALGMIYGPPGSMPIEEPSMDQANDVIRAALAAGITFFDTAPGYGRAEALLGNVIGDNADVVVATKVAPLLPDPQMERQIFQSLEASLKALRRSQLDIVQIHSANAEHFCPDGMLAVLEKASRSGLVGAIGATVYDEAAALAACQSGGIRLLQVAYNILDQRMADRVLMAARASNTGIVARSVLMKGVLGPGALNLPTGLRRLSEAASRLCTELACDLKQLPSYAIRFCVQTSGIANTLAGVSDAAQLDVALAAALAEPLLDAELRVMWKAALADDNLLNPSRWHEFD